MHRSHENCLGTLMRLTSVKPLQRFAVGADLLKIDWIGDSSVGFSLGSQGDVIFGGTKISAFSERGNIVVSETRAPEKYWHLMCVLPVDVLEEVGQGSLLATIFKALGIQEDEPYEVVVFDQGGYRSIEARPWII